jgi:hypothetical protein
MYCAYSADKTHRVVFYSTLWVSLRKEPHAGAAVRGEAQSLLPH